MRNQNTFVVCIALLATFIATIAHAQEARFTTDRKDLRLSESLRATLVIEGTAPLRVELPQQQLDPIADRNWKIQPVGTASVTPLGDNREKWTQTFRLDPYVPGNAMPVIFAAVKVNGREVLPGGFEVKVITTVAESKAENAKPVTGIEELPPPVIDTPGSLAPWWLAAAGILGVLGMGIVWRLRKKSPAIPPHEWAIGAFDQLEQGATSDAERVAGVATILREFIERRFGIPATRLTTAELLATAQKAGSVEKADTLASLLNSCDRAKFAGDVPDDSGCRDLLARCRQWVHDVSPALPGPG
ncbi:MAG: hypothetical protein C0467_19800 [Planctomycetaceae bacterium]|nr:hypothetical protein [Planctomycetaceae bacterium]